MIRFHIRVNNGDKNTTKLYWFVHKEWQTMPDAEQEQAWDTAVKELNQIYKDYGRFATQTGVTKFFDKHGFEITMP